MSITAGVPDKGDSVNGKLHKDFKEIDHIMKCIGSNCDGSIMSVRRLGKAKSKKGKNAQALKGMTLVEMCCYNSHKITRIWCTLTSSCH